MAKSALSLPSALSAWWSVNAPSPKMHLDRDCVGLERTADDRIAEMTITRPLDLGQGRIIDVDLASSRLPSGSTAEMHGHQAWASDVRPCRVCALAPVIVDALGDPTPGRAPVGLVFSSQPSHIADRQRAGTNKVSESGRLRLLAIADQLQLPVVDTAAGPVAFTTAPVARAEIVWKNLHAALLPDVTFVPDDADAVALFWTLFVEDDRCSDYELPFRHVFVHAYDEPATECDVATLELWHTAANLTRKVPT